MRLNKVVVAFQLQILDSRPVDISQNEDLLQPRELFSQPKQNGNQFRIHEKHPVFGVTAVAGAAFFAAAFLAIGFFAAAFFRAGAVLVVELFVRGRSAATARQ